MIDIIHTRLTLPSGKVITLVYAVDPKPKVKPDPLGTCEQCSRTLVYPLGWQEVEDMMWKIDLRCPDCEHVRTGVFRHEDVEKFDQFLNRGTDRLVDDLEYLTRTNMETEIESFISALQQDFILPEDF